MTPAPVPKYGKCFIGFQRQSKYPVLKPLPLSAPEKDSDLLGVKPIDIIGNGLTSDAIRTGQKIKIPLK